MSAPDKRVYARRVASYDDPALGEAVEAIFDASAHARSLGAGTRALIKPNLLAKHVPEHAVTTHPAVLRAVILTLQKRGVRDITVADSPGGVYTPGVMRAVYRQSGLAAVCEETGAKLYDACRWGRRASPEGWAQVSSFELIDPVLEADFIVDLPKVKTHVMTGMSCAVKNLFGTVPGLQKAEFHMRFPDKQPFGRMLADLYAAVAPSLVVADGVLAMEGDGPAGGAPRQLGLILGGEDGYSIDLAVCRLMGLAPERVPYLAAGMERGACARSFDEALLWGEPEAAAPQQDYRLPKSYTSIDFSSRAPRAVRWVLPGLEQKIAPRPKIDRKKCVGCGKCAEICPGHTIAVQNGKAKIDPAGCIRCFCCHEMCPVKAIEVKRFFAFHF